MTSDHYTPHSVHVRITVITCTWSRKNNNSFKAESLILLACILLIDNIIYIEAMLDGGYSYCIAKYASQYV